MKTYTFDEDQDKLIGKIGTPERDLFEYELQIKDKEFDTVKTFRAIK